MARRPNDDGGKGIANVFGIIAAVLLVALSLLLLLQLQHRIARRDCYVPHVHACASIASGRYTHF
jgi:hypothetical protein